MDQQAWSDHDEVRADLQARLNLLLREAAFCGMVVEVMHWPQHPLAMGNFKMVGEVRDSLAVARERMKR